MSWSPSTFVSSTKVISRGSIKCQQSNQLAAPRLKCYACNYKEKSILFISYVFECKLTCLCLPTDSYDCMKWVYFCGTLRNYIHICATFSIYAYIHAYICEIYIYMKKNTNSHVYEKIDSQCFRNLLTN